MEYFHLPLKKKYLLISTDSVLSVKTVARSKFGGFIFFVFVWYALVQLFQLSSIPLPHEIALSVCRIIISGDFYYHLLFTLGRMVVSMIVALVVSLSLNLVVYKKKQWEKFIEFFIDIGLLLPGIVLVYLSVIVFGFGEVTPVLVITIVLTSQLYVIIKSGFGNLNKEIFEMAKVYSIRKQHVLIHIWVPQIIPSILAGVRSGFSTAWKLIVLVEMFTFNKGIGYVISYQFGIYSFKGVVSWTVSFAIFYLLIEWLIYKLISSKLDKLNSAKE